MNYVHLVKVNGQDRCAVERAVAAIRLYPPAKDEARNLECEISRMGKVCYRSNVGDVHITRFILAD